jgi:hypothetical protein
MSVLACRRRIRLDVEHHVYPIDRLADAGVRALNTCDRPLDKAD